MAKEQEGEIWEVKEIPTESKPMIVNNKEEQAYTIEIAIAKILNNQEKIIKGLLN